MYDIKNKNSIHDIGENAWKISEGILENRDIKAS